jgi:hypothetical protein
MKSALFENGSLAPAASLVSRLSKVADESFTRTISLDPAELPSLPGGWKYELETAIGLKIKEFCDPHSDEYHGRGEPSQTASFFWLFRDSSHRQTYLVAGENNLRMNAGDWAVFDDGRQHALMAQGTWKGIAVQVYR